VRLGRNELPELARHDEEWLGAQDVVMRLSYPAGERMFVDFSGDKVPVTDATTGEVTQAEVFVAVLGPRGCPTLKPHRTRGSSASTEGTERLSRGLMTLKRLQASQAQNKIVSAVPARGPLPKSTQDS